MASLIRTQTLDLNLKSWYTLFMKVLVERKWNSHMGELVYEVGDVLDVLPNPMDYGSEYMSYRVSREGDGDDYYPGMHIKNLRRIIGDKQFFLLQFKI